MSEVQRVRQPYKRGAIVVAEFGGKRQMPRPCVVMSSFQLSVQSKRMRLYSVVPLVNADMPFGELSPRLEKRVGGMPAAGTAVCMYARSVEAKQVVGFVGQLTDEEVVPVFRGVARCFGIRFMGSPQGIT